MRALFVNFLTGVFFCNAVPHLVAGLRGELFPSPFSGPPGVGGSHPAVNVVWGTLNALLGVILLGRAPISAGMNLSFTSAIAGALSLGLFVACYFNRVRNGPAVESAWDVLFRRQ
jgi:hypothetical protein